MSRLTAVVGRFPGPLFIVIVSASCGFVVGVALALPTEIRRAMSPDAAF